MKNAANFSGHAHFYIWPRRFLLKIFEKYLANAHFFWPIAHFYFESGQAETAAAQGFQGFVAKNPLFFLFICEKEIFNIKSFKAICPGKWPARKIDKILANFTNLEKTVCSHIVVILY